MRFLDVAACAALLVGLAGCDASLLQPPQRGAPRPGAQFRDVGVTSCGAGLECKAADAMPMPADVDTLAANCSAEICGHANYAIKDYVGVDERWDNVDILHVHCPNGVPGTMPSDSTCWDCKYGCAGPACPPGAECITIPGLPGSDCQAFSCGEGWTLIPPTAGKQAPTCQRTVTGPPAPPVTTASVVNRKPRITWAPVPGATGYRIYRAADIHPLDVWNTLDGNATSYTDASTYVDALLGGPSGRWVSYQVVSLNTVGESSAQTVHYFSYSRTIPY